MVGGMLCKSDKPSIIIIIIKRLKQLGSINNASPNRSVSAFYYYLLFNRINKGQF